jgi:hypothetical protein
MGWVITLDPAKTIQFPLGRNTVTVPEPGLMLAIQVNNELLYERVMRDLKDNPSVVVTNEAGLKLAAMPLPIPLPIPMELVLASSGDCLFLATSKSLVREAIGVRAGKVPGVKDSEPFRALAAHLELKGNQFSYTDRRLSEVVMDLQKQALASGDLGAGEMSVIQKLFLNREPAHALGISARTATGWNTVSVGNQDSATMVLALPAVALVGMSAGLALPALAKAKSKAQMISCVSNLKQVGLAARIYANDHENHLPPAANWCDALKDQLCSYKTLRDPSVTDPSERCHYAYNAKLSGRSEAEVNPLTVMFFETKGGWNQHGGRELLLTSPRHPGVYVIGFADGSVQQVPAARVGTLRWDP